MKKESNIIEYLLTYGWIIMIYLVIIIGVVLWQMGIISFGDTTKESCLQACKNLYNTTTGASIRPNGGCYCWIETVSNCTIIENKTYCDSIGKERKELWRVSEC